MKANSIPTEELLKRIPREKWGIGWEAIMDAESKDIDFASQGAIFAYINTYIKRKEFNETYYHRRTKTKDSDGNTYVKHEYIMKSLSVTHALAVYSIASSGSASKYAESSDDDYSELIEGATADYSCNSNAEAELRYDLSALGIPQYFIDIVLLGERIVTGELTPTELGYLYIIRKAYKSYRRKNRR